MMAEEATSSAETTSTNSTAVMDAPGSNEPRTDGGQIDDAWQALDQTMPDQPVAAQKEKPIREQHWNEPSAESESGEPTAETQDGPVRDEKGRFVKTEAKAETETMGDETGDAEPEAVAPKLDEASLRVAETLGFSKDDVERLGLSQADIDRWTVNVRRAFAQAQQNQQPEAPAQPQQPAPKQQPKPEPVAVQDDFKLDLPDWKDEEMGPGAAKLVGEIRRLEQYVQQLSANARQPQSNDKLTELEQAVQQVYLHNEQQEFDRALQRLGHKDLFGEGSVFDLDPNSAEFGRATEAWKFYQGLKEVFGKDAPHTRVLAERAVNALYANKIINKTKEQVRSELRKTVEGAKRNGTPVGRPGARRAAPPAANGDAAALAAIEKAQRDLGWLALDSGRQANLLD